MRFYRPDGIAVDPSGTLFVTENGNHSVRSISREGSVITIAGTGFAGYVDGPGSRAQLNSPGGIGRDGLGNLVIADTGDHLIRQVSFLSVPQSGRNHAKRDRMCRSVPKQSHCSGVGFGTVYVPVAVQWTRDPWRNSSHPATG